EIALALEGEGKKVEKESPVVLGFERHEAPGGTRIRRVVQGLQVGGLPAQRRAVVDELYGEFSRRKIKLHRLSPRPIGPWWRLGRRPPCETITLAYGPPAPRLTLIGKRVHEC